MTAEEMTPKEIDYRSDLGGRTGQRHGSQYRGLLPITVYLGYVYWC